MKDKAEQERKELNKELIKRTFVNQMQNTFTVSLCKNGILGGYIVVGDVSMIYKTGKVTIPEKYRNLVMEYEDIFSVTEGKMLFLPTVSVKMKNDEEYKFIVFARKRFLEALNHKRNKK
ncbi:MAG: hypothetical protein IJE49_08465 [Agathobacter sp.]|nr:hypothetical protein [Agathobacter sp.]